MHGELPMEDILASVGPAVQLAADGVTHPAWGEGTFVPLASSLVDGCFVNFLLVNVLFNINYLEVNEHTYSLASSYLPIQPTFTCEVQVGMSYTQDPITGSKNRDLPDLRLEPSAIKSQTTFRFFNQYPELFEQFSNAAVTQNDDPTRHLHQEDASRNVLQDNCHQYKDVDVSSDDIVANRHLRHELFFSPTLKCDGRNSADTQVHLLTPSPLSLTQLPPVSPTTESPVDYGPQCEFAEPTIKRRKRADARQLEALHSIRVRTPSPFTEERSHIAKDLDMSPRSVDHFLRCQNRQGEFAATNPSHNLVTTPIPMLTPLVGSDSSSQIHLTPCVGPSGMVSSSLPLEGSILYQC